MQASHEQHTSHVQCVNECAMVDAMTLQCALNVRKHPTHALVTAENRGHIANPYVENLQILEERAHCIILLSPSCITDTLSQCRVAVFAPV